MNKQSFEQIPILALPRAIQALGSSAWKLVVEAKDALVDTYKHIVSSDMPQKPSFDRQALNDELTVTRMKAVEDLHSERL